MFDGSSRIQVGQGLARGPDPYVAAHDAARQAASRVHLPHQLALVFASPSIASSRLMQGLKAGFGSEAPSMVGCTTPFPVASGAEIVTDGVVVTLLAARRENLCVHLGVGQDSFGERRAVSAVEKAVADADLDALVKRGARGFLIAITPGFRYERTAKSPGAYNSGTLIGILTETVQRRLVVFGGSAGDDFHRTQGAVWAGYQLMRNAFVLAFVETNLAFGYRLGFGLTVNRRERISVDRLRGGVDQGHYVEKINGKDAWPAIQEITAGGAAVFAVGDALLGPHYAQPFPAPDDPSQSTVYFPRTVSRYTYLCPVTPERGAMTESARTAAAEALKRSEVQMPVLALAASCLGRSELAGRNSGYPSEEMHCLLRGLPGSPTLAGFYGTGEHCGALGHVDSSANFGIGVLLLGDNLYHTALLVEKLHTLARVGTQIQVTRDEGEIADLLLRALNDVGYTGGMISLIEGERVGSERRLRAVYAVSSAGGQWNRWEDIRDVTRLDPGSADILSMVVGGEVKTPVVILESASDPRCNQERVAAGDIRGQIIFPMEDPLRGDRPFGTLQIGIPRGSTPTPVELESLEAFVVTASHSIAVSRAFGDLRKPLMNVYRLSQQVVAGETIDQVLDEIVSGAAEAVDAEYASLWVADHQRNALMMRACYPRGRDDVWTPERRKRTWPLETVGQDYASIPGTQDCLTVPLRVDVDSLGVLSVSSTTERFGPAHEFVLGLFARLAAAAVRFAGAQLLANTLGRVSKAFLAPRDASSLDAGLSHQLSQLAHTVKEALNCRECSIFLIEPDCPGRVVLRATTCSDLVPEVGRGDYQIGQGLTGGIARHLRSVRLSQIGSEEELRAFYPELHKAGVKWTHRLAAWPDVQNEPQAEFLGVPMLWGDQRELLGVIRCAKKMNSEHFFAEDERLLIAAAEVAAIGLKQSRGIDDLLSSDVWQRHFRYVARHQMIDPLTTIASNLGVLKRALGSEQLETVNDCLSRVDRLVRLIQGLFVLQQMKSDYAIPQPAMLEHVRLKSLVGRLLDEMAKDAKDAGDPSLRERILYTQVDQGLVLDGYSAFLREAIANLLTNALRFSPADCAVEVTVAEHSPDASPPNATYLIRRGRKQAIVAWRDALQIESVSSVVTIVVADRGPGLPEAEMVRIFDPLGRISNRRRGSPAKGLGLGLSIVLEVARMHGGGVCVRSEVGRGAVFTLVFPS